MNDESRSCLHRLGATDRTVRIGQIWYDERSRGQLDPAFVPVANERLGRFFEADVIRAAIGDGWHAGADLVGIFSWRFRRKIPLDGKGLLARLEAAPVSDVYSFFGALPPGPIWRLAERKHPGILAAADLLFDRLGLRADAGDLVAPPVYQHHFIASGSVYESFVFELLGPALDAMGREEDAELAAALACDSGYSDPRHRPGMLKQLYGVGWLPLHPFIAERLFSSWLAMHPGITVHPLWSGRFVEATDVEHEPELAGRTP